MNFTGTLGALISSCDPKASLKHLIDVLLKEIWPLVKSVRQCLQQYSEANKCDTDLLKKLKDVFTVCCSQLNKCITNLLHIYKLECKLGIVLQESSKCATERLSWCVNKLQAVKDMLSNRDDQGNIIVQELDESLLSTPMYFVNWIDGAFENLSKLSDIIYKHKDSCEEGYDEWKENLVEVVSELHFSLDELLLSAMTLCKYCLPSDQHIVRARCQVVLRETKPLFSELVTVDLDGVTYSVTKDSLKLPMTPSNINILIDVLKDALYNLETNTNTALLSLLIHCFSNTMCPTEKLKEHLESAVKGLCSCVEEGQDMSEHCEFVKEFDFYNERLMQIGFFAISCSADDHRVSILRSGLASLEALDPHLVPALMLSADGHHARLLTSSWQQEVWDIRDNVFLIVDPAAFTDKCKSIMHEHLLGVVGQQSGGRGAVCGAVDAGAACVDFFTAYTTHEPGALQHLDLAPLLADMNKVLVEVKIVTNLVFAESKQIYKVKMPNNTKKEATMDQLIKRLKLLYTIVSRINCLFHPKDNEDQLFINEICEEVQVKANNVTHTINPNLTYVNTPKKTINISRSAFARTSNMKSPRKRFAQKNLSQYCRGKAENELSFTLKLDEMLDETGNNKGLENKTINRVRELSVLYSNNKKNKSSLRKAVLKRNYGVSVPFEGTPIESFTSCDDDFADGTSLQITEILEQLNDMTNVLNNMSHVSRGPPPPPLLTNNSNECTNPWNVLSIDITKDITHVTKRVWNIPINGNCDNATVDLSNVTSDLSQTSSQRSDVTTQERLNDLDLLDNKLNELKMCDKETAL